VHLADGTIAPAEDLPVLLPELDDFRPTPDGEPPLARAAEWTHTTYRGAPARRELNTMPQWAGSCWYYLRYMDPHCQTLPVSPEQERAWGPVDLYIGGVEHAVLHLLYARFWHKVLYDVGLVHTKEPFQKLFNQGMILAHSYQDEGGKYYGPRDVESREGRWYVKGTDTPVRTEIEKMSKSRYNVVNPDEVVEEYGADSLRLYEMFMGPLEQVKPWQTNGVQGVYRFLERVWRLFVDDTGATRAPGAALTTEARRALHVAIREATEGIETLRFNTPIAKMMALVNELRGAALPREEARAFLLILHPFAPHVAEELWARVGFTEALYGHPWPAWDEAALVVDSVEIAVQVNGKLRGTFRAPAGAAKEALLASARDVENVRKHLEGTETVKEIVVPGKLVNLVVKPKG
jgi:leucyl-tRNA synthetase